MDVYGIIMAGGGGSRFWPLSRQATPKQLLNLTGKDLMVNETLDRMGLVIPSKNMYIVTNCTQALAGGSRPGAAGTDSGGAGSPKHGSLHWLRCI